MDFSIPKDLMTTMTDVFDVERAGTRIASVQGFLCGSSYPNSIQLVENIEVHVGDWLINTTTGQRFYSKTVFPLKIDGQITDWRIEYMTESEYNNSYNNSRAPAASINIGTVTGPAIIGNQQSATLTVGVSIEDVVSLIATKPVEDLPQLCELVAELKKIESEDGPIEKGRFSRFSDLLKKHTDILTAFGGMVVQLLIGKQ